MARAVGMDETPIHNMGEHAGYMLVLEATAQVVAAQLGSSLRALMEPVVSGQRMAEWEDCYNKDCTAAHKELTDDGIAEDGLRHQMW